jgi:hypothetical protein
MMIMECVLILKISSARLSVAFTHSVGRRNFVGLFSFIDDAFQ